MVSQNTTDLQISVEEIAAWSRKLVITIPAARVRSQRAKVTKQISKRARLPGFRKGKVPLERLEARFGTDIDRRTRQELVEGAFREAVQAKSLEPISEPRVAKINYDRDTELTFEVAFDIRPEIRLNRIGGFRLSRPTVTVSDDEVEAQIELMRKQLGPWKAVDRRAVVGDSVEVEITPLETEAGDVQESKPYKFVLGEGRAIPEVEAAIMTLDPGQSDEFTVTFPDDFADDEQRGTSQRLRINVKQVWEQKLPELDEDFAQSLGDFEDVAGLREAIGAERLQRKEREIEAQLGNRLVDQIIEANPFEVPESMLDRYIDAMVGPTPEGVDPDLVAKAREEARPAAHWAIKRTLILQKIAEDNDLKATQEQVKERVEALARAAGRPAREVRAQLSKSGELRELEQHITEERIFDFLKGQSEIEGEEA